jgi:2'-5' RNA ligase
MRCFIALSLPEEARSALAEWALSYRERLEKSIKALSTAHRPRITWVKSSSYHLTLAFLGEIEGEALEAGSTALGALSGIGPIPFSLYAPDGFPHGGPWRVLLARLEDRGRSALAYRRVNEALAAAAEEAGLGKLNPDWSSGRPFSPHVTIARISGRAALEAPRAESAARGLPEPAGAWTIGRGALYKSELRPGGSLYTELKAVDL